MQGAQSGGHCTRGHLAHPVGCSPMGSDVGASGCGTMQLCTGGGEASVPVRSLHEGPRGYRRRVAFNGQRAPEAQRAGLTAALTGERGAGPESCGSDRRAMTTGCYEPRHAGEGQDKGRDHERRGERTNRVWVKHRVPQTTESHTTGRGNRGSERGPTGTPSRRPGRTRTTKRTHKTEGQHAHLRADRTKARDLPVPTYIPSPCPTPPRIALQAPPLLGFPCSGGLRGPPIRGRLAAPCPLPRRVSRFPPTQAGFVARPPGIRGGLNGIRGGLSAVHGSAPVCRSNPPGSRASPIAGGLGRHRGNPRALRCDGGAGQHPIHH